MGSRRKRFVFRSLAILLGVLPFIAAELVCYGLGWGDPDLRPDPFIGFESRRPLFRVSEDGSHYEIAPNRYLCFRPDSFLKTKPDNGFRAFCLGGSTVQGRPYSIESSFSTWMRFSLEAADPDRNFEVVNCGGISYASYRLSVILDEVLNYQPDLIILYTGHNEFLEDRTYSHVKNRSQVMNRALKWIGRSRLYTCAARSWHGESLGTDDERATDKELELMPTEVEARLDYEGGLDDYVRDDDWKAGVIDHFEFNLRSIVAKCRRANVDLWIVDPACNLSDCRPFKALSSDGLTEAEKQRFQEHRDAASSLFRTDPIRAVKQLEAARKIDPRHSGLAYDIAKSYELIGKYEAAKEAYQTAIDEDICPLRITSSMRTRLRKVAEDHGVPIIEVHRHFETKSPHEIPGGNLLVDHVHPSMMGHQMIDRLLMEQSFEVGIVTRDDSWEAKRKQRHDAHLETLDYEYYLAGQRRLEGLLKWSQGQSTLSRDEESRTNE